MIKTIVAAPKNLCIYNNHHVSETYDFLSYINHLVLNRGEIVTLDLSKVTIITAAASVLLFATVNTCQLMAGNSNVIRCIFPRSDLNPGGHNYIVKTGLARALHSGTKEKLADLTMSNIYFQSSINPSEILFPTLCLLTEKTELTDDQLLLLHTGIGEGMLNVRHHAYRDPANDEEIHSSKKDIVSSLGERWWQCAWYNDENKAWTFIICDIGLGIPKTYNYVKKKSLYLNNPELAVVDAFTRGNSKYVGAGRGNGSEDMKRPIQQGTKESLLIYSNNVKYMFCTGMENPQVKRLDNSFHGTLIQWTLYSKLSEE